MTGEEIKALLGQVQRGKIVALGVHDDDALFDVLEKAGGSVNVFEAHKTSVGKYYESVSLSASDQSLTITVYGSDNVRHGARVPKPVIVESPAPSVESRFAYLEVD